MATWTIVPLPHGDPRKGWCRQMVSSQPDSARPSITGFQDGEVELLHLEHDRGSLLRDAAPGFFPIFRRICQLTPNRSFSHPHCSASKSVEGPFQ